MIHILEAANLYGKVSIEFLWDNGKSNMTIWYMHGKNARYEYD